jgi:hypothetical protein
MRILKQYNSNLSQGLSTKMVRFSLIVEFKDLKI